jgi:hypothetical protein
MLLLQPFGLSDIGIKHSFLFLAGVAALTAFPVVNNVSYGS